MTETNTTAAKQTIEYASGNEMAAIAARQIGYDLMGYYPITPSTQIAENLDLMRAQGQTDLIMIAAEGEHSAAGICYGASVGGGRVFNATSANGLLYALEQLPVQSGTRYPMVMNVACRTVSGPLSIKGDHSDIMYMLNAGWILFFAHSAQEVYDFNLMALKLAEQVRLPAVVAFDGFFTSHQKRRCSRFADDAAVRDYIGRRVDPYPFFDLEHPITVGSYMNEPDLIRNRYELHLAMNDAAAALPALFSEYAARSGRSYESVEGYCHEDADTLLILLGSSFDTTLEAVDQLRRQKKKAGVLTLHLLRPFPYEELCAKCRAAKQILVADRQDSYGAGGGNLSLEVRAALQRDAMQSEAIPVGVTQDDATQHNARQDGARQDGVTQHNARPGNVTQDGVRRDNAMQSDTRQHDAKQHADSRPVVKSVVYGLGGRDFYVEDAVRMFAMAEDPATPDFSYYGVGSEDTRHGADTDGGSSPDNADTTAASGIDAREQSAATSCRPEFFAPLPREKTQLGMTRVSEQDGKVTVQGGQLNDTIAMPKRIAPGHGACPGCGIPVNLNLLLRAIEDPVILLFQTGCGMIVTTPYPKTSFKVPYVHNLFQNGAAALSGLAEMCVRKQKKGELPPGDLVFIMVSGDGGMDIGMGSAIGTALRGHKLLLFEYDNGGYMNTGYQLSYSTPKGAKSATSHVGKAQYGKTFFHKDMPQIMAAAGVPYAATAAESDPVDFIRKAAKAAWYAKTQGTAYLKALSACPLNWNDKPDSERSVIAAAVNCCFFPLYEIEQGKTTLNYDPDMKKKKIPVLDWLAMMGRTKHLQREEYRTVAAELQAEVDRRFLCLKEKSVNPYL
ncbi:MAG: thiamine pyrophosphate-dependent enzyme [Clostridium sp.]|nr:thiamine pyrophosphate-dependent enzyme [Clostridium sp.]